MSLLASGLRKVPRTAVAPHTCMILHEMPLPKAAAGNVIDLSSSEQLAAFLIPMKVTRESAGGCSVSTQAVPASRLLSQMLLHRPCP